MLTNEEAWKILNEAQEICSKELVSDTVHKLAAQLSEKFSDSYPLVLSVMGGAVIFTGQLLPLLRFPIEFDYIHATRYGDKTHGSQLQWRVLPKENVSGRIVIVVDDILDEGSTLAEIKNKVLELGAKEFYSVVFCEKELDKTKPIKADFCGLKVPNEYVFGFGMDAYGAWRNLPAIYALKKIGRY